MEEKYYSVSEAVRLIGVESHVLRYWEEELQLSIRRNGQGHRIYSGRDIETLRYVRRLRERGLQLKAVRLMLDSRQEAEPGTTQDWDISAKDKPFGEEELSGDADSGGEELICEIVPAQSQEDELYLFERILRRLMEDVVSKQNEKLEEAIAERMKEELEDFYLQYDRIMQEAAASREAKAARGGRIRRALRKMLGTAPNRRSKS